MTSIGFTELRPKDSELEPIAVGLVFKKESLVELGLNENGLWLGEDKELKGRFLKSLKFDHVEIPIFRYPQHDGNSSEAESMASNE